ncbi:MAG: hypothetical protein KDC38_06450, partial [Planctomycetes bacterium]|nr:hypothetical protein [Planctomycetota bacterium]
RGGADATALALHWVGFELETRTAWIYFEIDVEGSLGGTRWRDELLSELGPDTRSTLRLRAGDSSRTLTFDPDRVEVPWEEPHLTALDRLIRGSGRFASLLTRSVRGAAIAVLREWVAAR